MAVSINNFVNVNIADLPSTMKADNVNVIGLFTKEVSLFPINKYKIYQNADGVLQDFGYNSNTYKMASTIFNQSLNILAGGGYLVIVPMLNNVNIEAKSGELICRQILTDFFKEVNDGSFKIAIDGASDVVVSGLDFTNIKSLEDVASVINDKLTSLSVNCIVSVNEDSIIFTSSSTGSTSSVVISSDETGTDLSTVNYLNIARAVVINGKGAYSGFERIQDAYVRSSEYVFYEAIITSYIEDKDNILELANMIQSKNKIALFVNSDLNTTLDIASEVKNKSFSKTRILFYSGDDKLLFLAGYISKVLSINFNGNNTVYDVFNKEIVGIEADDTITDDILSQLYNAGVDCYVNIKGLASIYTSGENDFLDNILFKNWLKNQLEVELWNLTRTANVVPQTENGVDMIKDTAKKVFITGQNVGFISKGGLAWNLPIYLGKDKELFENGILNIGYFQYSLPINEQTRAERERRNAPLVQFACKFVGSIHKMDLIGYINY